MSRHSSAWTTEDDARLRRLAEEGRSSIVIAERLMRNRLSHHVDERSRRQILGADRSCSRDVYVAMCNGAAA
jgi:hypothetical protein